MAERPDLEYQVPLLHEALCGQRIEAVAVQKPIVLRLAIEGTPESLLVGARIDKVMRRGHFVLFACDQIDIVVAPMLAGRFVLQANTANLPRDAAMSWQLSKPHTLVYRDDVQMGKVYVTRPGQHDVIPVFNNLGIDVLSPAFTLAAFTALAQKRRDQVRVFLMDKTALDSFGNAYADEVLWAAKIHPKTMVKSLTADDLKTLHHAIQEVTQHAIATIRERRPPLDEKLRDFLKVRRRHGEPCSRCEDTIRKAGVHGHDTFFCPTCQPPTRKSGIVSWKQK